MDAIIKLMPYIIPRADSENHPESSKPLSHNEWESNVMAKIKEVNSKKVMS